MADYKRLVSYMYQYENGVKRRNVGYARVEARNGQCKITLHMQLPGQLDSIFPVYLIQKDNDELNLVYLGDSLLKGQIMDSKLTASETNLMGSGYKLSDIGGILLFLNDSTFYATEWVDNLISADEVMKALKPKPAKKDNPKKPEERPGNKQETIFPNQKVLADADPKVQELTKETVKVVNMGPVVNTGAAEPIDQSADLNLLESEAFLEEMKIPKYKLPRGYKIIERVQNPQPEIFKLNDELAGIKEENEISFSENYLEAASKEYTGEVSEENYENTMVWNEEAGTDTAGLEAADVKFDNTQTDNTQTDNTRITIEPEIEDAINKLDAGDSVKNESSDIDQRNLGHFEEQEIPDPPMAAHIFANYPRIYPFEDNEITLCVKIEPKDIGYLSKDAWALSNNSFLLHGYYSYQHLIFAKMKDRYGCRYILGIPGIYHNREKFMAKMFGFESFKPIRKRELRQGDFGYWYLPIPM